MPTSSRDDFSNTTKAALAKRSGFLCAICRAVTVGPSAQSPMAITNVGVAAHIAAASPGGPRYSAAMTPAQRQDIANGIWLCGIHAKRIDDDVMTWPEAMLQRIKKVHEEHIAGAVGIAERHRIVATASSSPVRSAIEPREYAFARVGALQEEYKAVIEPMLADRKLTDDDELGLLFCGSSPEEERDADYRTPWTVFVNPEWLRWYLQGRKAGFGIAMEIPPKHIYGRIPEWPDAFFEWLAAIVMVDATFIWQRHPDDYLVLAQPPQEPRTSARVCEGLSQAGG
jgi:hypothetical protein